MKKDRKSLRAIMAAAIGGSCLWAFAPATNAHAGTLRIAPVRVEVGPTKQFCSLSLSNDSAETASVQIRGYGWTKDGDGNDLLDRDKGPTVNPSIVSIASGETRLIRCSLPDRAGPVEDSYRLIIDELPGANPAPGMVKTLLRISIPVFRAPVGAAPSIDWSTENASNGTAILSLVNRGNRHAQISAILLHPQASQAAPIRLTKGFYLLAGGQAKLPLPPTPPGGLAAVWLETTQGRLSASPLTPEPHTGSD